jgi:hypothetical protein
MRSGDVPDPLDIDWVTGSLAIGGAFAPSAARQLVDEQAIGCVVDLRSECCDDAAALALVGIEHLHLPTIDQAAISTEMIGRGVAWVRRALGHGRRVLVHCQHGVGRSALLALCVLVEGGMGPAEALLLAKEARETVSPSPEQLRAFIAFARAAAMRMPGPRVIPSFESLARIAYRHLGRTAPPALPRSGRG